MVVLVVPTQCRTSTAQSAKRARNLGTCEGTLERLHTQRQRGIQGQQASVKAPRWSSAPARFERTNGNTPGGLRHLGLDWAASNVHVALSQRAMRHYAPVTIWELPSSESTGRESRLHRTRNLIIACAAAALAISALGAPVAAAGSGKMTVVQGRPGQVDVCVNNKEVKSGAIYGSAFARTFGTGQKRITVFKKNYRKCGGVKVASRLVKFPNGSDLTIVVTKFNPKIMVFDNKKPIDMTETTGGGWIVTRHASDIGPASFKYAINPSLTPWTPSADPQFVKGQGVKQAHSIVGSKSPGRCDTARPSGPGRILGPVHAQASRPLRAHPGRHTHQQHQVRDHQAPGDPHDSIADPSDQDRTTTSRPGRPSRPAWSLHLTSVARPRGDGGAHRQWSPQATCVIAQLLE